MTFIKKATERLLILVTVQLNLQPIIWFWAEYISPPAALKNAKDAKNKNRQPLLSNHGHSEAKDYELSTLFGLDSLHFFAFFAPFSEASG
jgi:hypothetical protein